MYTPRFSRTSLVLLCLAGLGLAANQSKDDVILKAGPLTFRWVPDWLQVPEDKTLGNTHGCVAEAPNGEILFNTDAEHAVVRVNTEGKWISDFGKELKGGLHGMTITEAKDQTRITVSHLGRHEVLQFNAKGEMLWTIGWPQQSGKYESKNQFRPTAVAIAPDGSIFVADGYGLSWVHKYDAERKYLFSFGGPGTERGKMRTPHGLAMDTRGKEPSLIVCDRENSRLQTFDMNGKCTGVYKEHLRRPCSASIWGEYLAVADLAGRVTILNQKFELLGHLGDNPDPKKRAVNGVPLDQWKNGEFLSPHGISWGSDGSLYVQDWNRLGRVTKLKRLDKR